MKKKKKQTTLENLDNLLLAIRENFGEDILVIPEMGIGSVKEKLDIVSTGSKTIDELTGIGGFPRGRIIEIIGTEGSGKTTLALTTIREAQKMGLLCSYIDTEQTLDKNRVEQLGVNFQKLAISQPKDAEEALDLLELLVRSGQFGVVVLDSVAALVPRAELEGSISDASIGLQARLMSKVLRKIVGIANRTNTMVIFINQIRQKVNSFFYQEVTAGGVSLKYYASLRIDCRRGETDKSGTEIKISIKKNKFSIPAVSAKIKLKPHGWDS